MENSTPTGMVVARRSFDCDIAGEHHVIRAAVTRLTADHPVALAYPGAFEPARPVGGNAVTVSGETR